jgi:hypothetical protein
MESSPLLRLQLPRGLFGRLICMLPEAEMMMEVAGIVAAAIPRNRVSPSTHRHVDVEQHRLYPGRRGKGEIAFADLPPESAG